MSEKVIKGIKLVFEEIADDTIYQGNESNTTWKELREHMIQQLKNPKIVSNLKKRGIKRIEIGSIAWFSFRKKTKGPFIALNTMFLGRLLKR